MRIRIDQLPTYELGSIAKNDGTFFGTDAEISYSELQGLKFTSRDFTATGTGAFKYSVIDAEGAIDQRVVTLNVSSPYSTAPDFLSVTAYSGQKYTINVLNNDTLPAGAFLRSIGGLISSGASGASALTPFGNLTYDPLGGNAEYKGTVYVGAGQRIIDIYTYSTQTSLGVAFGNLFVNVSRPALAIINGDGAGNTLTANAFDTVLNGLGGNDQLNGSFGADTLRGGDGDDVLNGSFAPQISIPAHYNPDEFEGGAGNDIIIGGKSLQDRAVFAGKISDYDIQKRGDVTIVRDLNLADGDDGTDTITGVEYLQFSDSIVATDATLPFARVNSFASVPLSDIAVRSGALFSADLQFALSLVSNPVITLSDVSGAPLPQWISYNAATQSIAGTAPANFDGVINVRVSAGGDNTRTEEQVFRIFAYTPATSDISGSPGDDTLRGTSGPDRIFGNGGIDTFFGSAGADIIVSLSSGTTRATGRLNTLSYANSPSAISVNFDAGVFSGGDAEGDQVFGIGAIVGSAFDDVIIQGRNVSRLDGAAGDDTLIATSSTDTILIGGDGADTLIGYVLNAGNNTALFLTTVSFLGSPSGVNINLLTGTASGGHAAGDRLINIQSVIGSGFADVIVGGTQSGRIWGGDGNDTIQASIAGGDYYGENGNDTISGADGADYIDGGPGADILSGGGGVDTLVYINSSAGVRIDLSLLTASGGEAAGDIISGFENVLGSNFDDIISGDSDANNLGGFYGNDRLSGQGGNDVLDGAVGDDLLVGGSGDDFLLGGYGNDILIGGTGRDKIYAWFVAGSAGNETVQRIF